METNVDKKKSFACDLPVDFIDEFNTYWEDLKKRGVATKNLVMHTALKLFLSLPEPVQTEMLHLSPDADYYKELVVSQGRHIAKKNDVNQVAIQAAIQAAAKDILEKFGTLGSSDQDKANDGNT